jgi:type III pantothenate kinase
MLLAIDVGNSHTVFGVWDGSKWVDTWRHRTDIEATEDEIAAWLQSMFTLAGLSFEVDHVACASVVPGMDRTLGLLAKNYFGKEIVFLRGDSNHGVKVFYSPPAAVGADRIANSLAALAIYPAPIIVVDFGTATTFDVIDAEGTYLGGAILAGPLTSLQALVSRTAKLPAIELKKPQQAIGRNTTQAIESGVMFGYAGAIDSINHKIANELGSKPKIIATGGLGEIFTDLCESIEDYVPMLTLDGIRLFAENSNVK